MEAMKVDKEIIIGLAANYFADTKNMTR